MQRSDIVLGLGSGIAFVKFTIPYTDLTGTAGLTQTTNFLTNPSVGNTTVFQIPQGGKVIGVCTKHSVAFAGPSISAANISIGGAGLANTLFTAAFDVFQAVANGTEQETALFKSGGLTAQTVNYTFTVVGANLSVLTAGSVDVYIAYLNVSTPSA